jgi:Phage capsid family
MPESDWSGLLPVAAARRVIESASQSSVVLSLARVERMPEGIMSLPVVATVPTASWVEAGARKPITEITWSAERLEAREIAAVTAVPDVYIDDLSFNLETSAEQELGAAVARTLDAAVLFGTDAPTGFPAGGVHGTTTPLTGPDALQAIDAGMSAVEAHGLVPDGVASSSRIGGALRQAYREVAAMPSETPAPQVYGLPISIATNWPADKGDAIVGAWQYLIVGIREDINFTVSREGVLLDEEGAVQVSAFQDDMTLVRVYMRVACVIGTPVKPDNTPADPFVAVDGTAAAPPGGSET